MNERNEVGKIDSFLAIELETMLLELVEMEK